MRVGHFVAFTAVGLAGAACTRSSDAPASAAANSGAVVQQSAASEKALFAPLPARMDTGAAPSEPVVALGRALYYETRLSSTHDVSCNSCHPLNAYGADGRARSFGDRGQKGGRNSPSVYNAAGHIAQFWDGRAPDVEAQAKGPILNPAEMGMPDSAAVLAHLRGSPEYRAAFHAAFPGQAEPVTYDNVGRAIGAFERGLVTPSHWDNYLRGDSTALSPAERRGLTTFVSVGCAGCHNGPYVGGRSFQKLGLRRNWPTTADSGRYSVTRQPSDVGVFKVASLRNVAETGPYFHDGSVADCQEAIRMMGRHQLGRELTSEEVESIETWMHSLTGPLPVEYIGYPRP